MTKNISQRFLTKAAEVFDMPQFSIRLCSILEGVALMLASAFLVLFAMGRADTFFGLGLAGCLCMIAAHITDLIPSWLRRIAKRLTSRQAEITN